MFKNFKKRLLVGFAHYVAEYLNEQKTPVKIHIVDGMNLSKATEGSAGYDLQARIINALILHPGARMLIPTGVYMTLPKGVYAKVNPRSGLALKHGITVLNAPGTIDSDYPHEIGVILINEGQQAYEIKPMERVAQLIFDREVSMEFQHVALSQIEQTTTRKGGFGHTGK